MNKIIEYGSVEAIPLYNCSGMTPEEWTVKFGMRRPFVGTISIIYGIVMEVLFVPCLLAMLDRDLFRMSCYKIMFVVGVVDMMALAMNSILTGYLAVEGAVFCSHPVLIYLAGLAGLGLWCCSCATNILLLVNRTLNVGTTNCSDRLFAGYRTWIALLVPVVYGLYFVFFTSTCVFSSKYYAWFYDPFIFQNRTTEYTNIPHGVNNVMIMLGTFVFYVYISFFLCQAAKRDGAAKTRGQSHQILYQSIAICIINQVSSSVYVLMNFISVPEWLIVLAQLLWQLDHGCPVIVYMTMNPTIRSRFIKKITFQKRSSSYVQPSTVRAITTLRNDKL